MGDAFSCEMEKCAACESTAPSPCCEEQGAGLQPNARQPVRLIVRVAAARPQDLRDVAEMARPVVTTTLSLGGQTVGDAKLRSVPGAWNPDVGLWVWHRESFRFSHGLSEGVDLAVRLLLIGPRSPRQLEEEPAPYAVSGATIALRDVYGYMVQVPRDHWTVEQKVEAGVLEVESARRPQLLSLYQTDWLTFAFDPLCELTLAFEVFGLESPRPAEMEAMAPLPPAQPSLGPPRSPRRENGFGGDGPGAGVEHTPAAPGAGAGAGAGPTDGQATVSTGGAAADSAAGHGTTLTVRLDQSEAKLGMGLQRTRPPRVLRVDPDLAMHAAGVRVGDLLIAVDSGNGRVDANMDLGSLLPLLAVRPVELTFAREWRETPARSGGDANTAKET